jgi:sporulation protein YlmC with PRC-barrel domain
MESLTRFEKKRKSFKQDVPIENPGSIRMEKTDKPLTRDALVSMQVIDSKGRSLGRVKDVCFEVGKYGISLSVENENGEIQTVEWDDVQAASDYIILKPPQSQSATQVQTQKQTQQTIPKQKSPPLCPTCHKPLTWIPQYKRWYCYNDKKYV